MNLQQYNDLLDLSEVDELPPADVVMLSNPSLVEKAWDLTHFVLVAHPQVTSQLSIFGKVYELLPP